MCKTALEMAKQAVNFDELDQSKIPNLIYRKITNEDLDMIYTYPEVNEALVPLRGDREDIQVLIESEWSLCVNQDTNEMIFCLGTGFYFSELSTRYLYFYQGKFCTFIDTQNGWEMSIFYQSPNINLNTVKEFLEISLIYGGEYFLGAEYIADNRVYDFIESKDLFKCYV